MSADRKKKASSGRDKSYKRKASGAVKQEWGIKQCAAVWRKWRATLISVLIFSAILDLGVSAAHRVLLQRGIAEEVLRFHVLANSDSEEDQEVKLLVRDAVLEWIDIERNNDSGLPVVPENGAQQKTEMGETAVCETDPTGANPIGADFTEIDSTGKESELRFLAEHLSEIEERANRVLKEHGMSYHAHASIENCYFPERSYGDCTFPAGWYDALRICLGEAKGHNWWCVLYPGLCFSDCLHAVVDGDELADLKEVLTVEEYESLLRRPKKWKIAFRWF